jgi:hypothetical protein
MSQAEASVSATQLLVVVDPLWKCPRLYLIHNTCNTSTLISTKSQAFIHFIMEEATAPPGKPPIFLMDPDDLDNVAPCKTFQELSTEKVVKQLLPEKDPKTAFFALEDLPQDLLFSHTRKSYRRRLEMGEKFKIWRRSCPSADRDLWRKRWDHIKDREDEDGIDGIGEIDEDDHFQSQNTEIGQLLRDNFAWEWGCKGVSEKRV